MPHAAPSLDLEPSQVQRLEQWAAAGSTPQQVALRCRIALLARPGEPVLQIARVLDVQRPTVRLWRDRVAKDGIGAVWDIAPGRGRKPSYGKSRVARFVKSTLQDKPHGSTHWSTRAMAKAQGISKSTVQRIWDDHQLKPHLARSFKLASLKLERRESLLASGHSARGHQDAGPAESHALGLGESISRTCALLSLA